ncbi:MAG: addiction module protein [Actinomycetota bacterium]
MAALPRDEIEKLPLEERLRIVEEVWESIRQNPDALPLTDAQRVELDRRLAAHSADPAAARDLDDILASLRSRD